MRRDISLIITCETCESRFRFEESRLPPEGAQVRCSRCGCSFFVPSPDGKKLEAPVFEDLPPAEEPESEENLLEKTLAEFNVPATSSSSRSTEESLDSTESPTHVEDVGRFERSDYFGADVDTLGNDGEDEDKSTSALEDLDFEFERNSVSDSPATASQDDPADDPMTVSGNARSAASEDDDDESMMGLIEPLAAASSQEDEEIDQLGNPEEWDLIGSARVDPGPSAPPRKEDLSVGGVGLADLVLPSASVEKSEPNATSESTAQFKPTEKASVSSAHPSEKISETADNEEPFVENVSSGAVSVVKQSLGWVSALLFFVYAGSVNLPEVWTHPAPSLRLETLRAASVSLYDVEVTRVENQSGAHLLVVSGELGREAFGRSEPVTVSASLLGGEEGVQATFGAALPENQLRERSPEQLRALLEQSGRRLARQGTLASRVRVQAIFETALDAPRELGITVAPLPPEPMVQDASLGDALAEQPVDHPTTDETTTRSLAGDLPSPPHSPSTE